MKKDSLKQNEIKELIAGYESELSKLDYQAEKIRETILELSSAIEKTPTATKKRRGRPKKATTTAKAAAPKRRGRPKKATTTAKAAAPKRRGRPKKAETTAKAAAPKRRGRPKKAETTAKAAAPKRRGRPKKAETTAKAAAPKRRGRPKKAETTAKSAAPKRRGRPKKAETTAKAAAPKRRGRPKKAEAPAIKRKVGRPASLSSWDDFVLGQLKSADHVLSSAELADIAKKGSFKRTKADQIKIMLNRSFHKLANKKGLLIKTPFKGRGFAYGLKEWSTPKGNLKKKYQRG